MSHRKNIFLIEDDEDDQFFFKEALNDIKSTMLQDVACNGVDALAKLENLKVLPDVIFMDINMPRMNGIECLTEIMKNEHLKDIPVVILSSDVSQHKLILGLGAKAFIKKSSDSIAFRDKLQEVICMNFSASAQIAAQAFGFQHLL